MYNCCSDEGERFDSDGEAPSPKQRNSRLEYKDSESLDSPEKSVGGFKAPLPSKTAVTTKQPVSSRPIKKVDLGAAATFAKEAKEVCSSFINDGLFFNAVWFAETKSKQIFR